MDRVLPLGDPLLRRVSARAEPGSAEVAETAASLHSVLASFHSEYGFGRAVAAPQIGVAQRVVALDLGRGPQTLINPEITWRSEATFTLWDDCMSFPDLLVRLRRARSISVRFADEVGEEHEWEELDPATSELLQHEIDHLDGVLAIDRALDRDAIVTRAAWAAQPEYFRGLVDGVSPGNFSSARQQLDLDER